MKWTREALFDPCELGLDHIFPSLTLEGKANGLWLGTSSQTVSRGYVEAWRGRLTNCLNIRH